MGDYEISERNDGKKIFAFIAQEEDDYVFINASKSESFTVSQYGLYEYLSHSGYEHTIHLYKNQPIVFEFKDVDFPVNVTVSKWKISDHSVGITGSFNYWDDNDIEMTDENEDGIYEGVIDIPNVQSWQTLPDHNGSATIQFKVRLDKSWNDEWAEYEYYRDRTYNSQVNCAVPAEIGSHLKIYVYFDTTKMSADALEHEDSGSRLALKNGTVDSQWYEIRYTYEVVSDRVQGDTNGDGKATIADSLMIARYEVKLRTLTNEQLAVSDVNYDGKVTIADALKIARYEVKLIDSL